MSNVRGLRQKNFSRPLVPSAEKLQASNSSQLEAIRGGLLTYDTDVTILVTEKFGGPKSGLQIYFWLYYKKY